MNFKPHMYMKQNCKSSIKGPTYPRNMHAYWRKIIIWSLHSGVFRIQERGAKSGSLGNGSTPMGFRGRAPVDDLGAKSSRSCGILYAFWSQQNSNICVTCRKFRSQKIADVRDARGGGHRRMTPSSIRHCSVHAIGPSVQARRHITIAKYILRPFITVSCL